MTGSVAALPIFRSRAQARLLTELYVLVEKGMTLSRLADRTGIPVSTVQREVEALEKAGLVVSERIGNARIVRADRGSPFYDDLRNLLLKAFGPAELLAGLLRPVRGVERAFIFGSWARRYAGETTAAPHDLDVLVVGAPDPDDVYSAARAAEEALGMEVNVLLASHEEWADARGILTRVKKGPLVELVGADD